MMSDPSNSNNEKDKSQKVGASPPPKGFWATVKENYEEEKRKSIAAEERKRMLRCQILMLKDQLKS